MADGVDLGSAYGRIELDGSQAQQTVNSLAQTMRDAGAAMSIGVTAPLVGIAAAAVNSAGEFEQSLNVMAQVSGATADQMAAVQTQALQMGAVTSFSAGEAATAQLELAKAGLSVDEVMSALPGVLDMAAAGGMGLGESAEIAANAMNAFNLPASEMGSVANMLAAAANASSVDIGDLAAAMKMSGAVFASNQQPMDDMVTALAMLGNAGLKGSDAGTSLKTMLLSLASPTDKAAGVINTLGLSVYDAEGNMRGFSDILNDLSLATGQMSDEQRNAALSTIFGSDAIRAASILTRDYSESWDATSDALGDGSAAANVAGARMKGMRGAIEYLKGSIDSFLIGAALPYLDVLGNFVRMGADALTAFAALPKPIMDAAVAFAAVLAAAGPLMLAVSGISAAVGFLLSPIGLLVAGVAAVAAGFVLWQSNIGNIQGIVAQFVSQLRQMVEAATGVDFGAVADGLRSFGNYIGAVLEDGDYLNDWLTHLPAPIQPAVQALGQLVAAFAGLTQTGDVGAFVASIQAIDWGGALGAIGESLSGLATGVVAALQGVDWGGLLTQAGDWLAGLTSGVVGAIQSIDWGGALTAAGEWLAALRDGVADAVTSIDWGGALTAAGDFVGGLTQGVISKITSIDWGGLLTQAGDYLSGLWGNVTSTLNGIDWSGKLAAAAGWLDGLKGNVVTAIQGIDWAGALAATGDAFGGLETAVEGGLRGLGFEGAADSLGNVRSAVEGLPETFAGLSSSLTTVQTALGGFWAQATALGAILATFFAPAMGRLQEAFAALPEALAPMLPKLQELGGAFGGLLTALQPLLAIVGAGLAVAVDFGVNRLATAFATLPDIIGPIIDQITATIQLITTIITEVTAGVQAAINGDWAGVWESAKGIVQGFSTFFRGLFSRLGTFMSAVATNITQPVIDTLRDLGVNVDPLLKAIQVTFKNVWGAVQTAIQSVVDIVGNVTEAIGGFKSFLDGLQLRNPFEGIAAAGQGVLDAIGKVGNVVSGGGADGNPATPEAGGTSYFRGGMAQINERGYEQIVLPAGSRVYTNGQTNNMAGQEPRVININLGGVTVANEMDGRKLGGLLRDQLALLGA